MAPIIGSLLGRSFTVDVSEPKPNRPNTMNLVKKWAQELGLSEGFINSLTGSWGSKIVKGVEEGWMLILRLCPRMNSSSSRFSGASRSELSRVLRAVIPPPCETSVVIYHSTPFILIVHLLIMQVATWVPISSSAFLNLLWVTADKVTLFWGHSFINATRLPTTGI